MKQITFIRMGEFFEYEYTSLGDTALQIDVEGDFPFLTVFARVSDQLEWVSVHSECLRKKSLVQVSMPAGVLMRLVLRADAVNYASLSETPSGAGGTSPSPDTPGTPGSSSSMPVINLTYDVTTTTNTTKLMYSGNYVTYGVDSMKVDGESTTPATSYNFNSKGEHAVSIVSATIGNTAFYGCNRITKVIIPYGVTRIGSQAFDSCTSLADITIPDTIVNFGSKVFPVLSGATIRIVGQLTAQIKEILKTYFIGSILYVNGTSKGTITNSI